MPLPVNCSLMELEQYIEPSSDRDHQLAIEKIWSEHVRATLLGQSSLLLCELCAAFFYASSEATHPPESSKPVRKLFHELGITSLAGFKDLFKAKSHQKLQDQTSKLIWPRIDQKHRTDDAGNLDSRIVWLKTRLIDGYQDMKTELEDATIELAHLRRENSALKKETECLMLRLFKMENSKFEGIRKILMLSKKIVNFCEEDDPECTADCRCNCAETQTTNQRP